MLTFLLLSLIREKRQFLTSEIHACTVKYSYMKLQEIPSERVTTPHSDAHMIDRVFSLVVNVVSMQTPFSIVLVLMENSP